MKITIKELCEKLGLSRHSVNKYFRDNNIDKTREVYSYLDFKDDRLLRLLKDKYAGIVSRCRGRPYNKYDYIYRGKSYLSIKEWVYFCNINKIKIENLWDNYLSKGKNYTESISVDRVNDHEGYTIDNLRIVTQGFNSWKRNNRPIEVKYQDVVYYFMSCEEGSSYFNVPNNYIGKSLRKKGWYDRRFEVQEVFLETVLKNNSVKSLEEYYMNVFKSKRNGGIQTC